MPFFHYHLPGTPQLLSAMCSAWHSPLPADRFSAEAPSSVKNSSDPTYGDYFTAARHFLAADGFATLVGAVSSRLGRSVLYEELHEIHITIVKHGAFYHPALVTVHSSGSSLQFVLNTAVSKPGRQTMENEYPALEKLGKSGANAYVPTVYGWGRGETRDGRPVDMFLADWFDGFHEFHLSRNATSNRLQICVWDDERGLFFLSAEEASDLYRQTAFILTACYNPRTFEQIFPWHHAAGDFVVRLDTSGLHVRLITVRQYASLFRDIEIAENESAQRKHILLGLLFFLLNLSIRMRIDRLDGTGNLVWGGEETVSAVWEGFFSGLQHSFFPWPFREDMASTVSTFLAAMPVSEVFDLARAAAGGFHPQTPERSLIDRHLLDHVAALWAFISQGRPA
ncbi:MAG: hypothetical protein V2B19_08055 [Pseudomonadota bacterium]